MAAVIVAADTVLHDGITFPGKYEPSASGVQVIVAAKPVPETPDNIDVKSNNLKFFFNFLSILFFINTSKFCTVVKHMLQK